MHSQCELDIRDIDAVLGWLESAASLPGKSPLAVATMLANISRSKRRSEGLTWNDGNREAYELTKVAVGRGLNELEAARLVEIEEDQCRRPSVSLLSTRGLW